jgi:hypothetical protein
MFKIIGTSPAYRHRQGRATGFQPASAALSGAAGFVVFLFSDLES